MTLVELHHKLESKQARLAVIGLGYVGFPVACEFARVGFDVLGIELQQERVESINAGNSPISRNEPGLQELTGEVVAKGKLRASNDYQLLADRDVIIICVETPVDEQNIPQYNALRSALIALGSAIKEGALIIIESTLSPGTMRDVVLPTLEQSGGKRLNKDFYLGNCPERVMPGKLLANIRGVSRVVGGMTPETAHVMQTLYRHIMYADIDQTDCITAELVKTVENAYRDVQIAFANEMALICEKVGGDVWKVRELVNKNPGRMMLLPGAGVGGHCIPKDPWLLTFCVQGKGIQNLLIPAARAVNNFMPYHMVELLTSALESVGKQCNGSRLLVMGYAYLEESDDIRNSPSVDLVRYLQDLGAQVQIHDPYIAPYQGRVLEKAQGCDAVIVMVRHHEYRVMDLSALAAVMETRLLIDGRAVYSQEQANLAGFSYWGVGIPAQKV